MYHVQRQLVEQNLLYRVPKILDTVVALFMEHVQSGTRLYPDNPLTYTSCQEKYETMLQFTVGGFATGGLDVYFASISPQEEIGVGAQRKF